MRIVTTHANTDFDALASLVAATLLYPGSIGIMPSHGAPEVRSFFDFHQDLFRVRPRKSLDPDLVESLIVVDANNWKRLDRLEVLSKKTDLEVIVWDHHMEGATIHPMEEHREEVGATVTLLLEEMERRDTPFTPMHATLFLLGIYDDTGCLSFTSATPRDARMVAFLLENGADLNIVSAFLTGMVDEAHSEVFSGMLDSARAIEIKGLKVGLCLQPVKSGLTMLANLVTKYREFKGLDAVVGIFPTGLDKSMIIGRSNPRGIDIGFVMRALGGGGHPGAGSAVIKGTPPEELEERVMELIHESVRSEIHVREIMSPPEGFTAGADMTMARAREILEERKTRAILIREEDRFLGILSDLDCEKAERAGRAETSVKGYMKRDAPKLSRENNGREALRMMRSVDGGILPVIEDDRLVGVVLRSTLLLHIYDI